MTSPQFVGLTISVVIPTADRGALLQRSLDCVLAQTTAAAEIILVDNGREDAHTQNLYERVRVIRTAPRIGPGRARNIGAQAASSELVAFLDDDDLWQPDYLERVIERFQETAADAVLGQLMRQPVGQEAQPYKVLPDAAEQQRRVFYSNPGFGGQKFIPETLNKLRAARARLDAYEAETGRHILLEIDGGVKTDNIAEIARAGADTFVAGSAVFGAGKDTDAHRYDSIIGSLRAELATVQA